MPELVEFLRARLAEDEAMAQAATPGPWGHNPGKMWLGAEAFESFDRSQGEEYVSHGGPSPFTGCVAATGPADQPQSMADAAHIARHDPARTLAEVAAKRRIIADYEVQCDRRDRLLAAILAGKLNSTRVYAEYAQGARVLLSVLQGFAAVHAQHADYPPGE